MPETRAAASHRHAALRQQHCLMAWGPTHSSGGLLGTLGGPPHCHCPPPAAVMQGGCLIAHVHRKPTRCSGGLQETLGGPPHCHSQRSRAHAAAGNWGELGTRTHDHTQSYDHAAAVHVSSAASGCLASW
jgi:hypothetical protein